MNRINYLSELLSSVFARQEQKQKIDSGGSFFELSDALLSRSGEKSGNELARALLNRFAIASDQEKLEFFQLLASRFDINAEHALRAAQHYAENKNAEHLTILMDSVEPRRQELFRRLNRVPGATNELVQMRACLLKLSRQYPELLSIDVSLLHLFRSWFNQGFLVLREIDWHSPANILEKIIAYEAVHAINSWSELRSRLQPDDRRCFAFFHPAMLDEPLIFVEVALVQRFPETIDTVLAHQRKVLPDTDATMAVFYSISDCQKGLAGVSFGNFLIKQVARELSRQLPSLKAFCTLSPVPGFMQWVNRTMDSGSESQAPEDEQARHRSLHAECRLARQVADGEVATISTEQSAQMKSLVTHYLVNEKRSDHLPLDAVARFHLGNGASLDAILPEADNSAKGLSQSAGIMVSYRYDLDKVEDNHEAFANEQRVVVSSDVRELMAGNGNRVSLLRR